jgi:hypothetical protein
MIGLRGKWPAIVLGASALLVAGWWLTGGLEWWAGRIGDLDSGHSRLLRRSGTLAFDSTRWRKADEIGRGHMVADLMTKKTFVGAKNDVVERLLGPRNCYVVYDDEPCYRLTLDGKPYQLEFGINHAERLGTVAYVTVNGWASPGP